MSDTKKSGTRILHIMYFYNYYFTTLFVSSTLKCKISPAQMPLLPSSVVNNINLIAASDIHRVSDPMHSTLLRPDEGQRGQGNCRTRSALEAAETALHRNSFLRSALHSFNSNGFREKATLPQLLLSQHLLWQAIIRAIEVLLSLFILLKCYNRSNNTFTFALFFLSTQFKIL